MNRACQYSFASLVAVVVLVTSGCGVRVVSQSDDNADSTTTTTTTTTVASGGQSDEPTPTTEAAPETDDDGATAPPTTDGAPGGGSLAEPISCDEFEELTPGGRMLSVYNGSAPDSGCDDLIAPARLASDVFAVTAELAKSQGAVIGADLPSPMVADATCADGTMTLVVENAFSSPLVLWGALMFLDAEGGTVAFKPFISDVLQPGDQTTFTANGREYKPDSCDYDLRPLVAPVGDLTPDVGGPDVGDEPQASDRVEEWFPALMQSEEDARVSDDPADFVDFVEDIHSPDLWVQLFLDGAIEAVPATPDEPDPTVPSGNSEQQVAYRSSADTIQVLYCKTLDNPLVGQVEGEFAMVLFEWAVPSSNTADSFSIGLYRRGSDNRWRYIGRTVIVWEEFTSSTPRDRCDPPPIVD